MKKLACIFATGWLFLAFASAELSIEIPVNPKERKTDELRPSNKYQSVSDFLKDNGISLRSTGGLGSESYIQSRSFTENGVKVVIDGVEQNTSFNSNTDLSTIPIADIESMRFDPSGFNNGQDYTSGGGVLYITTKRKTQSYYQTGFSVTSYKGAEQGSIENKRQLQIDPSLSHSILDTFQGWFTATTKLTDNASLNYSLQATKAENNYFTTATATSKNWVLSNNVYQQQYEAVNATLGYSQYFSKGYHVTIQDKFLYSSRYDKAQKDYKNDTFVYFKFPKITSYFSTNLSTGYRFWQMAYKAGNENSLHKIHSFNLNPDFQFNWGAVKLSIYNPLKLEAVNSTDLTKAIGFSGHTKAVLDWNFASTKLLSWNLIVPISLVYWNLNQSNGVYPVASIGIKQSLNYGDYQPISILLTCYQLFRHPDFQELFWKESKYYKGNPNLKPEQGIGADATLKLAYKDYVSFTSVFYVNNYKNSIHWFPTGQQWTPSNVSNALFWGASFKLSVSYFGFTSTLSYNYDWNKLSNPTQGRIMLTPKHSVSFKFGYSKSGWFETAVSLLYVAGRTLTNDLNSEVLPAYLNLGCSFTLDTHKIVKPFIRINNLLSQVYYEFPGQGTSQPTRSITLGVNCKW